MNAIKINDSLKIKSVDVVWPDELGFTVKFKVTLDDIPYSLHMQTHEDGGTYFTDAPFYGYKRDYSDLYDLLNEDDYDALLSECMKIYIKLKSKSGKSK